MEKSIEGRLSREDTRQTGVESDSDEGEVGGGDLIEELKAIPIFSGLGPKSLVRVLPALETRQYAKGTTIIKQGEPGDAFYITRSGEVQVVLEQAGKPSIAVAQMGPGEGFGEMALLTDQPRNASLLAVTDVEVWRLHKAAFETLLSENISLALFFSRIITQRLSTLQQKIVS